MPSVLDTSAQKTKKIKNPLCFAGFHIFGNVTANSSEKKKKINIVIICMLPYLKACGVLRKKIQFDFARFILDVFIVILQM